MFLWWCDCGQVLDRPNAETDRRLAQHLVALYYPTAGTGAETEAPAEEEEEDEGMRTPTRRRRVHPPVVVDQVRDRPHASLS